MPANFLLTLDTTGPGGVTLVINDGLTNTAAREVLVDVATTDADTTGYQVKVWGDVDPAGRAEIQSTEAESAWIMLTPDVAVLLAEGDGAKTLYARLRDDVWNESNVASSAVTLDQGGPIVTITGPDVDRISKVDGKRLAMFAFSVDSDVEEYEVRVVPAADSPHTVGTLIGTANGSHVPGVAQPTLSGGPVAADEVVTPCVIDGRDLEAASPGDGDKIVKVFARDAAGNWSI